MGTALSCFTYFLFASGVSAALGTVYIRTPVGDTIPHTLLAQAVPGVPVHELHTRLHHLDPNLKLILASSVIDLNKQLGPPRRVYRQNTSVFVDNELSIKAPVGYMRSGNEISITTTQDGLVVSVQVPGKLLQPVQLNAYPNLFVDVKVKEKSINFGNDERHVPKWKSEDAQVSGGSGIEIASVEPTCRGASAPPQYAELAIAADSALCSRYGSAAATETAIFAMLSNAEAIYKQSMCIRLEAVIVDIKCDTAADPYVGLTDPLDGFKTVWETLPASSVSRDVVLFVTGVNYLDNVAGQAYVGVTCFLAYSYMWVDLMNELVFAHELGHNLNTSHATERLTKATINLGTDNFFSQASIDEIVAFVDAETSRSICIQGASTPSSPPPPTPSPSPFPAGPATCATRFLQQQSMNCFAPGTAYTVNVPLSYNGQTGILAVNTYLEQRFGFGFGASVPSTVTISFRKQKTKLTVSLTNVQALASFNSVTQTEVASQNSPTSTAGGMTTAFYYPGPIDLLTGVTSCCGQTFKVFGLTAINLSGSGVDSVLKVFVVRSTVMQCVQYGSCALGFTAMSDSVECPGCLN